MVSIGCSEAHQPGVYSDMRDQLDWIKGIIGDCNEETCNMGNCMTRDDLVPSAIERFENESPHLIA